MLVSPCGAIGDLTKNHHYGDFTARLLLLIRKLEDVVASLKVIVSTHNSALGCKIEQDGDNHTKVISIVNRAESKFIKYDYRIRATHVYSVTIMSPWENHNITAQRQPYEKDSIHKWNKFVGRLPLIFLPLYTILEMN